MIKILIGIPNYELLLKENALQLLDKHGAQLCVNESGKMATTDMIRANIADADAYIAGGEKIDRSILDCAKKLKIIARYGVGVDNIDLSAAKEKNIRVTTTVGANANSVAEHAVMLMLAVQRRAGYYASHMQDGTWVTGEFPELTGKTVGLIGYGRIGRLVFEKLSGFRVKALVHDPYVTIPADPSCRLQQSTMENLLRNSDIVSLHVPGTEENRHLIGEQELSYMKKTAYLINTSRGSLIDEKALYNALIRGVIAGAGLDVLEKEPCEKDNPLLTLDQVLITPHIAGGSYENHQKAGEMCVKAIIDLMDNMQL